MARNGIFRKTLLPLGVLVALIATASASLVNISGSRVTVAAGGGGGTGNVDLSGLGASTAMNVTAYDALSVPAMAAGTVFSDVVTGTRTVKVTDSTTPNTNQHFNQYSNLGAQISQAWGAGLDTYTILFQDSSGGVFLADYQLGGNISNRRTGPSTGEGRYTWSTKAGEAQIIYYTNSTTITRYSSATNSTAAAGIFPASWSGQGPGGASDTWLQINADGSYFTKKTATGVTALKTSDGTITNNAAGTFDELIGPYSTVACLNGNSTIRRWDILANTLTTATLPSGNYAGNHMTIVSGADGLGACPAFDTNTGSGSVGVTMIAADGSNTGNNRPGWYWGQWHNGGFWFDHASGYANQYWIMSFWRNADSGNTANMAWSMAFVKASDFSKKVVGGHYSVGDTGVGNTPGGTDKYRSQPHATVSFDGKLIMFTSNMHDSGRLEVFLMETPRS